MPFVDTGARRLMVGCLLVLLGTSGCDLRAYFKPTETVYVTATALNLREKPTTRARILVRLTRGQELEVVQKSGEWIEVRANEKTAGWVHGNYVGDPAAVRAALQKDLARRSSRPRKTRSVRSADRPSRPQTAVEADALVHLSIDGMLAGLPEDMVVEEMDPIEGQPRLMGGTSDGQVVVEFWGPEEALLRAEMMVSVVDVPDDALSQSADLAVQFVRNAVPRWKRDGAWMMDFLKELSSRDKGQGGFDAGGKVVRFNFIKPLGSIRISIQNDG